MKTRCAECGMLCDPAEFHPFAACLMFKGCHDGDKVRANLAALHADQQADLARDAARYRLLRAEQQEPGEFPGTMEPVNAAFYVIEAAGVVEQSSLTGAALDAACDAALAPCGCKWFCHKDEPKGKYIHEPGAGYCQGLPVRRKPAPLRYRSQCTCLCHSLGALHVMPCCQPDPDPVEIVGKPQGEQQ